MGSHMIILLLLLFLILFPHQTKPSKIQADLRIHSKRTILPLRTGRRAHRFRPQTPHAPHLRHRRHPDPPDSDRPLPSIPIPREHSQPWRLHGQPAPFPHCEVDRSHLRTLMRQATLPLRSKCFQLTQTKQYLSSSTTSSGSATSRHPRRLRPHLATHHPSMTVPRYPPSPRLLPTSASVSG